MEIEIEGLEDLQKFFDKISTISMHQDWDKRMGDVWSPIRPLGKSSESSE